MANSRKYQVRNAGVGSDLTSGTNNYKLNRTTGAYDTYTDDATIATNDIVIIGKKSNISDRIDALEKNITVLAAATLLDSGIDGIAGTYTNALTATKLKTARTISLGGDLGGSVSFDGSGDVTITATVQANSVILGTDTTGNYMSGVTAGSGISVTHTPGEGSSATIAIDTAVTAQKSDVHYIGTTSVALNRASANMALTGISSVTLPGSTSGTVQIIPAATAGTGTVITLPATTGTVVTTGDSASVTNGMLAGSIANAKLVNSAVTVGTTSISLGASSTTLAGLTSVTSTGFTGALTGNASTATTLQTARTINGVSFDGSANVTVTTAGTGISVSGTAVSIDSTVATLTGSQTLTNKTLTSPIIGSAGAVFNGSTSGTAVLSASATAGTATAIVLPSTAGTLVGTGDTGTVSNTMLAGSIANAKLANSSVTVTAGTGLSGGGAVSLGSSVTLTNAGVTSNVAGTGISVSGATGAVTITNTGVTSIAGTTNQITASASTGGVTLSLPSSLSVTDLSVSGNLTVSGTTTTISSSTLTLSDPMIYLATGNSGNTQDIGFVGHFNNGTYQHTGLARRATDSKWYLFSGVTPEVTTTVDFTTWTKDTLLANIEGNLTGAVTGNASTATTLQTARLINGVSFNGSADVTVHTAGTGISISGTTVTNTGVTSAAVSGTGLSINASTGGVTITSNATSANTASTIVARDASGNFTAGTVTAALSGNATTATTLQTARAINGVSFNGSADVTVHTAGTGISVSGTTVTNTGIITASAGTGISVSGTNPLTITNTGVTSLVAGTNIAVSGSTGAVTVSVSGTVASATAVPSVDRDRTLASTLPTTFPQSVRFDFANASAVGTNGNYAGVMTFAPYTGTSASTGDASYQLAFGSTATNGSGTPRMRIRNGIDSTWNSFYEIPNSANIGSYAVTTLATSGSGISVNASQGAVTITSNATTASTASTIVLRDTNGYIQNNYFYTSGGGSERNASGMGYFAGFNSSDYYIRSYTPAAVAAAISGQTMNINGSSTSCSGAAASATNATNVSGGNVQGSYLGVQNTSGSTGYGLSLYNGSTAGQPQYGIFFGQTASWGTHGNVTADWATYFTMDSTANRGWIFRDTVNGNKASISNTGNATFAGEVTAYSDIRLKTNVVTIDKALDKVVKLRGVYFDKDGKRQIGVIAQEVREVFPEVVGEANDEMKTLHVNHGAMVGALIESTKDLNDKIEAQAKEIAELKALVQQLLSTK